MVGIATNLMDRFVNFGVRGTWVEAGDSSSGSSSDLEDEALQVSPFGCAFPASRPLSHQHAGAQALAKHGWDLAKALEAERQAKRDAKAKYTSKKDQQAAAVAAGTSKIGESQKKVRKKDREPKWDTHPGVAEIFFRYLQTMRFLSEWARTGGKSLLSFDTPQYSFRPQIVVVM